MVEERKHVLPETLYLGGVSEVFSACVDVEESAFTGLRGHFQQRSFVRRSSGSEDLGPWPLPQGCKNCEEAGLRRSWWQVSLPLDRQQCLARPWPVAAPPGTIKQF